MVDIGRAACYKQISTSHISGSPEENRDLAGCNFCANFAFSHKVAIFRKFCLGAQFLRKFATLRSAIFRKFCNLREDIFVFPLKFTFSVLGWCAIKFCANWAKIGLLC